MRMSPKRLLREMLRRVVLRRDRGGSLEVRALDGVVGGGRREEVRLVDMGMGRAVDRARRRRREVDEIRFMFMGLLRIFFL
jgi:hypothetical protein